MLRACSVPLCSHRWEHQVIYLFLIFFGKIFFILEHIKKCNSKISSFIPQILTIGSVELKYTVDAWKLLNIKKSAFVQLVRIQDNALFIGARSAAVTSVENFNYCYHCPLRAIVTLLHILLSCVITKK